MERRYQEHIAGTDKCKYTRSFPPLAIAACWTTDSELSLVLKIEAEIKKLSKPRKQWLIEQPKRLSELLLALGYEPQLLATINGLQLPL